MRKISFTKAEREVILQALEFEPAEMDPKQLKLRLKAVLSVREKIANALDPKAAGANAGELERALITASRGKVVPVTGGGAVYARISKQSSAYQVTVDQMILVGQWLSRQPWAGRSGGVYTILTVLQKWPDWHAQASHKPVKKAATPGLNDGKAEDVRQGVAGGSGPGQGLGTPQGFR